MMPAFRAADLPWVGSKRYRRRPSNRSCKLSTTSRVLSFELLSTIVMPTVRPCGIFADSKLFKQTGNKSARLYVGTTTSRRMFTVSRAGPKNDLESNCRAQQMGEVFWEPKQDAAFL